MCGIAFIRLKKDLNYYVEKYGSYKYGLKKLYLLMQKQHNRGQNGAGVATIKINVPVGKKYMNRERSIENQFIEDTFKKIQQKIDSTLKEIPRNLSNPIDWISENVDFIGDCYIGHLRYGTYGANKIENCHPFLRQSNWRTRNLVVAGNFNLTNVEELFNMLVGLGQHPRDKVDTVLILEKIGHFLDEENQRIIDRYKDQYTKKDVMPFLQKEIDLIRVLKRACRDFDGGYSIVGATGNGDAFIARDPNGIRPAYFYEDEEVIVAASEKTAIKTAFGVSYQDIQEIKPAHALIIKQDGKSYQEAFIEEKTRTSCSFERIYFSRGTDPEIYQERKMLGKLLTPQVLQAVDYDIENTVFSYIPNTAETAFLGLMKGIEEYLSQHRQDLLSDFAQNPQKDTQEILKKLAFRPRVEKLVIKDAKLRTFITDDSHRDELVAHVYDTTYEVIKKGIDNIVLIDDSIVRGTTLEKSILKMVNKLEPKKIVIVSSAPQIRYPDCYGIDMSRIRDFVAFRAAKELIEERGMEHLLENTFEECKQAIRNGTDQQKNYVQAIYAPFSEEEISQKIAQIVRSNDISAEVSVVFQTVKNLHQACPNHIGDWYFTGNYPTEGGNRVVNMAFVNFMQGSFERAY
ncbi:MAG: amidophosphoribosyltransferase [Cytophagales bacterium]|nr:MAG: amidophosphoribosyltransferase [Cytophagales bacterium]